MVGRNSVGVASDRTEELAGFVGPYFENSKPSRNICIIVSKHSVCNGVSWVKLTFKAVTYYTW